MVESGSQKTQNYFSNYFHIQFVVAKFCLGYRLSGHNTKLPTKNKIKTRPPTQCPRLLSVFPTYLLRGVCRTRASSGPSRFFINDNKTILSTSPPRLPLTQQQPPFPPSLPPFLPTYVPLPTTTTTTPLQDDLVSFASFYQTYTSLSSPSLCTCHVLNDASAPHLLSPCPSTRQVGPNQDLHYKNTFSFFKTFQIFCSKNDRKFSRKKALYGSFFFIGEISPKL